MNEGMQSAEERQQPARISHHDMCGGLQDETPPPAVERELGEEPRVPILSGLEAERTK